MKVLVTGANGFVGQALCAHLEANGHEIVSVVRRRRSGKDVVLGDIGPTTNWEEPLNGCDAVAHLAARVHVMHDTAHDPLTEFRKINTEGALNLARQAAAAGVGRFVYLSSIKVNGEETPPPKVNSVLLHPGPPPRGGRGCPSEGRGCFSEDDEPAPQDAYAVSKWEAEQGLMTIARKTEMEVVLLRPPLVYGPGVGANFLRLLRLVERGVPLPFGATDNRRSLLYLGNLVDAITLCLTHPTAANRTYLVSDGEDVSTPELIQRLAAQMGRPARLWPVPTGLLELAGRLVGKGAEVRRLLGSLAVDSGRIRRELGWRPPYSLDEGLAQTVRWYRGEGLASV